MTLVDIAAALLRTTLATSAAALAAWALLAWLRIDAPRIHRLAWLLVIAQGWLFFPLTIEIKTASPPTTPKRAAGLMPAETTKRSSTQSSADAARGREPFATSDSPTVEAPQSRKAPDPLPLPIITIASWLLGAIALAAIAVRRYLQVLRMLPLGSPPDDPQWQAEWHAARAAAKLRRRQPVDLRITTSLGPLLHWAPWAYLILAPRPLWTTLAAPQRQAILRHELAHLRRGDLWKSLAIRVLALPQWFNPLAWLAIRRFDEAAEWACDDAAAATAASRLTFAESLLQSAEYAAAFPASAPAARGVLTRRIQRLVNPRFKEESKMKLLVPPLLLLLLTIFQTLRIERVVAAETPQQPPCSDSWSLAEQFNVPLGERLKHAEQRHSQLMLLAERQRQLDAAKSSNLPAAQDLRHSGPPLSQEQIDFDRLTKEFESFARADYVIEPPDILSIESDKLVPKASHRLETFDELQIRVSGALTQQPIDNAYNIDADGSVNLGPTYGRIEVVGQTIEEAEDAVRDQLSKVLTDFDVSVSLLASSSAQAITGQHLVAMDGRVNLGYYGSVYVAGMTRKEARAAIERKLAEHLDDPKVFVDLLTYNSKVYYVITEGARLGDDVTRAPIPFPVDGKENVAEALARTYDNADRSLKLSELASATLSLHRPAPNGGQERVYPIAWDPSTQAPTPLTNHGILPGDRIFIKCKTAPDLQQTSHLPTSPEAPPAVTPGPFPRYGVYVDDAVPADKSPSTPSTSPSGEAVPEKDAELSVKRVGDSLLLVRRPANEKASGEPSEDADMNLKIAPRWLESHRRRLQPYDTIKLRVARPHRPAHVLTWRDVEGQFTVARDGSINFGREQGSVHVSGMTVEEARAAIERQLRKTIPDCEVSLELGSLASQKFFVSIQRPDGTEIAAGALPTDSSMPASFQLGGLRSWLGNVGESSWELAEPSASSQDQTYLPGPGDRLVIKVPADFDPLASRPLPLSLNDETADSTGTKKAIARPFWIEVFGDVSVKPLEFKLPISQRKELGFVPEPRFLPNLRGPNKAESIKKGR